MPKPKKLLSDAELPSPPGSTGMGESDMWFRPPKKSDVDADEYEKNKKLFLENLRKGKVYTPPPVDSADAMLKRLLSGDLNEEDWYSELRNLSEVLSDEEYMELVRSPEMRRMADKQTERQRARIDEIYSEIPDFDKLNPTEMEFEKREALKDARDDGRLDEDEFDDIIAEFDHPLRDDMEAEVEEQVDTGNLDDDTGNFDEELYMLLLEQLDAEKEQQDAKKKEDERE